MIEPVLCQAFLIFRQILYRQAQVVGMFHEGEKFFRLLQGYLPVAGRASGLLDPLVHGVHHRSGEVRLRVGQLARIVRASSLGQCQESLGLQLWNQHATLPGWSGLYKELGQHGGQAHVLNDQRLSFL